ncbi:phage portal protein [Consotaella salsifontis]|uniref:Phage portal protein, HK97 family n=1 Tax=Consotaella salsifontis TaxID=1365950 RepID=A0A1T4MF58_9HYPH|nr:phage portal protein [Consotaella salsifontis]SJZ65497.1 phage portal protein, HK97 family [Consotaella salsifontis]
MGLRTQLAAVLGVATGRGAAPGEAKAAPLAGGAFLFSNGDHGAPWSERSYSGLSRTGFMQNPIVYRSVRLVSEAAAAIPLLLYDKSREIEDHPILALLRRPNGADATALLETLCGHLLLSGNAYLEAALLDGQPRALYALRPDRMRIVEGADGWPEAYEYRVGGAVKRIAVETGPDETSPLLHIRLFHPLSDGEGYAPLSAAQGALDLHNAAARWNKALLDNSARPSGALVYSPGDGGNLSADAFDRLKAELESGYTGAARAGRPMLLEGGLDWKAMALSPKDMDFIEAKNQAAREIALAFGVPPMLLGIPGDNTYANYAEANRAFFRLTVLPLMGRLTGAIGGWLAAHFGEPGLRLGFDADGIEGLAEERAALWRRIGAASFLTDNEKREAVGYGPRTVAAGAAARG